jgi:hypothetical protein
MYTRSNPFSLTRSVTTKPSRAYRDVRRHARMRVGDLCAGVLASTRRSLIRCRDRMVEAGMARRRIGQEDLPARSEPRAAASQSQLAGLIDRAAIDRHPVGLSASAKGEPGWPPLALLTALRALPEGWCSAAGGLA